MGSTQDSSEEERTIRIAKFDKWIAIVVIAWIAVGTFGDEVFGLVVLGWESDALGFPMSRTWWWIYQLGVLLVFAPAVICLYVWRYFAVDNKDVDAGDNSKKTR